MMTRQYAIEEGGPARLELTFEPAPLRDLRIVFDGAEVGAVADEAALRAEPTFGLSDGSVLRLAWGLEPGRADPLRVTRDGKLLPSPTDPQRRLTVATRYVHAVALGTLGLSALALITRNRYLEGQLHLGWGSFGLGLALLLLAWLASRRSLAALVLAMSLFAADGLVVAARSVSEEGGPVWPVPLRLILLLPMARGLGAIRELRRKPGR